MLIRDFLAVFTFVAVMQSAHAQMSSYALAGTCECRVSSVPPLNPGMRLRATFTVRVSGDKWWIELRPTRGEPSEDQHGWHHRMIAASDGTNIYELNLPFEDYIPKESDRFVGNGHVEIGPIPRRLSPFMRDLWLATASGSVFRAPRVDAPFPWIPGGNTKAPSNKMGIRASVAVTKAAPFIPNEVAYVRGGNGTELLMRVLARTNANGLSLPLNVRIQYSVAHSDIHVTEVLAAPGDLTFPPQLRYASLLRDYRFAERLQPFELNYVASNWMSFEEGETIYRTKYPAVLRLVPVPTPRSFSWSSAFKFLGPLLVLLVVAVFFFYRR